MSQSVSREGSGIASTAGPKSWVSFLFAPVDIACLAYFRVVFGVIVLANIAYYYAVGLVEANFLAPRFHFTYLGFEWVRPWPGALGVHLHLLGLALLALCVALGFYYRISSVLFALGFTHFFLIDKALYQNHYYLLCLVSWIMVVLPAHRAFSLDAIQSPQIRLSTVPAWTLWLLRFQIGVPYFFGGIAKLNADWLAGAPFRFFLAGQSSYPVIGRFFTEEWCVQLFVHGGLWFDLLVVPALLWRRTRLLAFVVAVLFHLMNHTLFNIGIFPWFMIFATPVFLPPDWPRRLLGLPKVNTQPAAAGLSWAGLSRSRQAGVVALGAWVTFQIVWPLRHLALEGNPSWTEQGHFFAWHMMLRAKTSGVRYYVTDPKTGRTGTIDLRPYLTAIQLKRMSRSPDMVLDFAHFLARELHRLKYPDVEIHALLFVSLNGRKPQLLIDPNVNLAAEPRTFRRPRWILPLVEPLREKAWDVPLSEWEKHLHIPPLQFLNNRPAGAAATGLDATGLDGIKVN